jgi:hypothetical protein
MATTAPRSAIKALRPATSAAAAMTKKKDQQSRIAIQRSRIIENKRSCSNKAKASSQGKEDDDDDAGDGACVRCLVI